MLALLPFFAFNYLFSALCQGKTALFSANQNQVIFFMYIINAEKSSDYVQDADVSRFADLHHCIL